MKNTKLTHFTGDALEEISFPLGGIGTGSLGIAGNGRFTDWEIYNRPAKGSVNGYSHFAVKAEKDGELVDARILNGDTRRNFHGFGKGLPATTMAGFPHFRECEFIGEFPLAVIELSNADSPLKAKLTAFNPFIPHNAKDSSIPCAMFVIEVTNDSDEPLELSIACALRNPYPGAYNEYFESDRMRGLKLTGEQTDRTKPDYGELTLATDSSDISYQEYWYRGIWRDELETYWRNLTDHPRFTNRHYDTHRRQERSCYALRTRQGQAARVAHRAIRHRVVQSGQARSVEASRRA